MITNEGTEDKVSELEAKIDGLVYENFSLAEAFNNLLKLDRDSLKNHYSNLWSENHKLKHRLYELTDGEEGES